MAIFERNAEDSAMLLGDDKKPPRLGSDDEQLEPVGGVRFPLAPAGERRRIQRREAGGPWEVFYAFSSRSHLLSDFSAGCQYHQTSPDSPFTRGILWSLATPDGRVSISGQRLIITDARGRTERPLADEAATLDAPRTYRGIDLSDRPGGDDRA